MMSDRQHLQRYIALFQNLREEDLALFKDVFAPDARFKDPFNDVRGVPAIQSVFRHMFDVCLEPRFEVHDWAVGERGAYLHWTFYFSLRKRPQREHGIEGMSRVSFDAEGLVCEHIDYWDAAGALYERLPIVGALLRRLRAAFAAR